MLTECCCRVWLLHTERIVYLVSLQLRGTYEYVFAFKTTERLVHWNDACFCSMRNKCFIARLFVHVFFIECGMLLSSYSIGVFFLHVWLLKYTNKGTLKLYRIIYLTTIISNCYAIITKCIWLTSTRLVQKRIEYPGKKYSNNFFLFYSGYTLVLSQICINLLQKNYSVTATKNCVYLQILRLTKFPQVICIQSRRLHQIPSTRGSNSQLQAT